MGCVSYRGYWQEAEARQVAEGLQAEGWDVYRYGVPAYSTLGYSNWLGGDPLLSSFLRGGQAELARLLFHELAHQQAYARDDSAFNESYATAVERLGGRRWLDEHASPAARAEYAAFDARRRDFKALTLSVREDLAAVYADPALDDAGKRAAKARRLARLQADVAALKAGPWQGYAGYDRWLAQANNAAFGIQAAYDGWVPAFEALFEREGRDFNRFYAAVRRLADLPADQRAATLAALQPKS
jgi:predicted aminopeptidase